LTSAEKDINKLLSLNGIADLALSTAVWYKQPPAFEASDKRP